MGVQLFMVIEKFRQGPEAVRSRFVDEGRQFGPGLVYVASWIADNGHTCFQLMEAPDRAAFDSWIAAWADLVEFEVVPVATSTEFWARWEVERRQSP